MRHDNFLEILDELQEVANENYTYEPGFLGQYKIYYNNKSLNIIRVIEYSYSNNLNSLPETEYRSITIYSEKIINSIFLELLSLINYCKKNLPTNQKRYDLLLQKVRKLSDFQDFLECI